MFPLIAGAARVLATSTRAASAKSAQAIASGIKKASGAIVESKAIDKFVKLNDKLSKNNRRDNKDNLNYIRRMEKSIFNMQRSMDSISKSSKGFVNNIKMLVGLGGVGGMLYTFLKITESYGSPQSKFRGRVTSTSLRDQKAFEQMLAVKGINKPDLLDRLGMAATEGGVVGTTANKFFSRMGIDHNKFLSQNSAGRLSMVLDKWDTIKNIPSVSKFFEEFLGSSWAEIKAMREIGDLESVYKEKRDALKDINLYRFSNLHESLENVKQSIMNGLVKVFDKLSPTIEKVSKSLGEGLVKVIDWLSNKFKNWNADEWGDAIISLFEKIESIINFLSNPMKVLKNLNPFADEDDEEDSNKANDGAKTKEQKEKETLDKIKHYMDQYNSFKVSKNFQRKAGLYFSRQMGIENGLWGKYKNYTDNLFFDDMTMEDKISDVVNMNIADFDKRWKTFVDEMAKRGEKIDIDDKGLDKIRYIETRDFMLDLAKYNFNKQFDYSTMASEYDKMYAQGLTHTQITLKIINNDINQQNSTIQYNKK